MAATIECPRCSEPVTVMPRRLDADQYSGQCKACGLHFVVHKSVLVSPPPETEAEPEIESEELRRRRQVRNLILVFAGVPIVCVVLGLLILIAGWFGDSRRHWRDEQQRTKLIAMKAEADGWAARGRFREADARYKQIAAAAEELRKTDDEAQSLLDEVEVSRRHSAERQASDLAARQGPPPTPAVVSPAPRLFIPPVTQPVAETKPARPRRGAVIAAADGDGGELNDAQIERAIARGSTWLRGRFNPDNHLLREDNSFGSSEVSVYAGLDALCVYALIESGLALRDTHSSETSQWMENLIEALKKMPIQGNAVTYARGLRATALAVFNRPQDRNTLREDVAYLLATHNRGAYDYSGQPTGKGGRDGPPLAGQWDNSNSQYGLLGVWSAAEAGVSIPPEYWTEVEEHWTHCQNPNGQWGYNPGDNRGTVSMTAAGTASLFVTHDYLGASRSAVQVGREPFPASLRSAMRWWETADNAMTVDGHWWAYAAYGIERVGLASGFRYLGKHDWYREVGKGILFRQLENGSFGDEVDTAYSLLFLSRGRSPVLINKLRFDGAWSNRPRDLANLTRYAGKRLEREVGWQVVNLRSNWQDWLNAPVMYFASHQAPELTDFEIAKLRSYVEAGGLLFTQADGDSPKFDEYAKQLAATLFPQYPLQDLPADHLLYNIAAPVKSAIPLKVARNGSRLLIVHSSKDLGRYWHGREEVSQKDAFALGLNLLVYASGKGGLRNRLESPFIEPTTQEPTTVLSVARLQYDGDWNPEPAAWPRFTAWLRRKTAADVNEVAINPAELTIDTAPMAHLTGTRSFIPTETDAAAIRRYVEAGGTLLIDAAGGQAAFAEAAERLLAMAFPDKKLEPLPKNHPMLNRTAAGMDDVSTPRVRPYVIETSRNSPLQFLTFGRGRVIFSRLDITTGLLGTRTWGIAGYDPEYTLTLVKNILFWTADERAKQ